MNRNTRSGVVLMTLILGASASSCTHYGFHTRGYVLKREKAFYEKGLREGRARVVRENYHQEQLEKARPTPPPAKNYYKLPMPEYQDAQGIWRAPHTTTIGITQS